MDNIIKDIKDLGLTYDRITYTSDYFPQVRSNLRMVPLLTLCPAVVGSLSKCLSIEGWLLQVVCALYFCFIITIACLF